MSNATNETLLEVRDALTTPTLPTGGATAARQDTGNASLASIATRLAPPTLATAITPSDSTDLTNLASVGITVGGDGNLAVRCVGAPSTTVTIPVVAGQFVWGQFTRVMAATTATGLTGWAP